MKTIDLKNATRRYMSEAYGAPVRVISRDPEVIKFFSKLKDEKDEIDREILVELVQSNDDVCMRLKCIVVGFKSLEREFDLAKLHRWNNEKMERFYFCRMYVEKNIGLVFDYQTFIDEKNPEQFIGTTLFRITEIFKKCIKNYNESSLKKPNKKNTNSRSWNLNPFS